MTRCACSRNCASKVFPAGRDRIVRLRRELALRCKQKRKFKATTNSNHDLPVADNYLPIKQLFNKQTKK